MSVSNVSSSYLASALLPAVRQTQSQLATLEVESSTGEYANLGLQLGNQSGYELSLKTQVDLMQAMTTANGVTETNLTSAQAAMSSIYSSAQTAASGLVSLAIGGVSSASEAQTLGQSALQQLISVGNTSVAGSYVFAGANSSVAPLNDYYAQPSSGAKTAINSAFQSYFGFGVNSSQVSTIAASQMQSFLSGPFAAQFLSPAWGSNWSTASSASAKSEISPGIQIATSATSNTAGFQQLAQGYAMLSEFAGIGLSDATQRTLVSAATSAITQGSAAIVTTQAQLGGAQTQITQANDAMSGQMNLLQTQINQTDSVDPAQVATQLSLLTTQLQSAYRLTAQIASLSLAQYLPT
jgi:flagellar hook-associated protein 3 FlgL